MNMKDMNKWQILDIEPTHDRKMIKKAYGQMLKKYHPEENPKEFILIQKAYKDAYASSGNAHVENFEPVYETTASYTATTEQAESEETSDEEGRIDFAKVIAEGTENIRRAEEAEIAQAVQDLQNSRSFDDFKECVSVRELWQNEKYIEKLTELISSKRFSIKKLRYLQSNVVKWVQTDIETGLYEAEKLLLHVLYTKVTKMVKQRSFSIVAAVIAVLVVITIGNRIELKHMKEAEGPAYVEQQLEEQYGQNFTVTETGDATLIMPGSSQPETVDRYKVIAEDNPNISEFTAWKEKITRTSDTGYHQVYDNYLKNVMEYACDNADVEWFSGSIGSIFEWDTPNIVLNSSITTDEFLDRLELVFNALEKQIPGMDCIFYIYPSSYDITIDAMIDYGPDGKFDREDVKAQIEELKATPYYLMYNTLKNQEGQ